MKSVSSDISTPEFRSRKLIDILLGASVFFIPMLPFVTSILWGVICIYWIFANGFSKESYLLLKKTPIIIFIFFYLYHVIGMFWTTDWEVGLRDLTIKIPMILFPLFFCVYRIGNRTIRFIKTGLITGCIIASLICFVNSCIKYSHTHDYAMFFYTYYSFLLHPGYFAMTLNLAVLLTLNMYFFSEEITWMKSKIIFSIVSIYFLLVIIILSSKMALITTVITVPIYLILEAQKRNKVKSILKLIFISMVVSVFIFIGYLKVFDRFSQVTNAIEAYSNENIPRTDEYYNSSTLRIEQWKDGYEVFKENWLFGVGTGDIDTEMMKKYKAEGFEYEITHFELPSSQFLQTAIILGIIGLALLLVSLFLPLFLALKRKHYLYAGVLLIFILNSVTGTIFSATGVLVYGFFNSFFYILSRDKEMAVGLGT